MNSLQPAVTAASPYPSLKITEPNRRYASLLLQDIASQWGEMTAISQYLYEHWILEQLKPEIAALLMRIAQTEMHRLDILGKLVVLLGGNPLFRGNPCNCNSAWSGNMLLYQSNFKQILTHNISMELAAINDYTSQAESIKDPFVSEMLLRLAEDEKIHCRIFRSLLENSGK